MPRNLPKAPLSLPTQCANPERFGVVEFTPDGRVLSIEEKPAKPCTQYAIPGIYFYDNHVIELSRQVKPTPTTS